MKLPITSYSRPEVHGHRGCRGLYPENTLPAFLHALQIGVDVLELDVVLSADGQVVVSHEPWMSAAICLDPNGQRIPERQQLQHNLYHLPYATIYQYDCGQLQHPGFPQQHTLPAYKPLLREVVAATDLLTQQLGRSPIRFSVEVKSTPAGDNQFHPVPAAFAQAILAELLSLQLLPRTTLLSFDVRLLQQVRQQLPELPVCLLVEDAIPLEVHIQALGFWPEVYGPRHDLVTSSLIVLAAQHGTRVVPWTVNDGTAMQRLLDIGVAGITTDYPNHLLALLHR